MTETARIEAVDDDGAVTVLEKEDHSKTSAQLYNLEMRIHELEVMSRYTSKNEELERLRADLNQNFANFQESTRNSISSVERSLTLSLESFKQETHNSFRTINIALWSVTVSAAITILVAIISLLSGLPWKQFFWLWLREGA